MHELSIARAVIAEVSTALAGHADPQVSRIRVRVGRLAGIDPTSLQYGFEFARVGTMAEHARLEIESVAVSVFCQPCDAVVQPDGAGVVCPNCATPSGDIRRGRELIIGSVDVTEHQPAESSLAGAAR